MDSVAATTSVHAVFVARSAQAVEWVGFSHGWLVDGEWS